MMFRRFFIYLLLLSRGGLALSQYSPLYPGPFIYCDDINQSESLPLISVDMEAKIAGTIAYVELTQSFVNRGGKAIEAIYVFPASASTSVHGMEMRVGAKVTVAKLMKNEKAQEAYEKAKSSGYVSSMLEQKRPNVFEVKVGNVLPGDVVSVKIIYTEALKAVNNTYAFVHPLTIGSRYSSQDESKEEQLDWVSQPVFSGPMVVPDLRINVEFNGGVPISSIHSPSHDVIVTRRSPENCNVTLRGLVMMEANRDFILEYTLSDENISSGLLIHKGDNENFFSLTIHPPSSINMDEVPVRDYLFIVDVSGSMYGKPIERAKELMVSLLSSLRPFDRFNIILFSGKNKTYAEQSVPASPENIETAMKFIRRTSAGGVTSLLSALEKGFALQADPNSANTIVVLTDGYVTDEKRCLDFIRKNLNKSNVYAFGIGSSVNRYLIEGIAFVGKGHDYFVTTVCGGGSSGQYAEEFIQDIKYPVLSNVKVDFGGTLVYDMEPVALPDVMYTRPVTIYGKFQGDFRSPVKITGFTNEKQEWTVKPKATDTLHTQALPYLWARNQLKLMDDYEVSLGGMQESDIADLSLRYSILSKYTSFVAIDYETKRSVGNLVSVRQPQMLPVGVTFAPAQRVYNLANTGAVARSASHESPYSFMGLSEQTEVVGHQIALRWTGPLNCDLTVEIRDIFNQVLKTIPMAELIILDLNELDTDPDLWLLTVMDSSGGEEGEVFTVCGIRRVSWEGVKKGFPVDYLDFHPKNLKERIDLALVYEKHGYYLDAVFQYEQAMKDFPGDYFIRRQYEAFISRNWWVD